MSASFPDFFDSKTRDLEETLADAKCTLEELNECGDLEDRMNAALAVEDAERNLSRHLLRDPQEDSPASEESLLP